MAQTSDLMNLGIAAAPAALLGGNSQTITAAGTIAGQASAANIPPNYTPVYIVAATAGASATILSTAWSVGVMVTLINDGTASGVTASVFCPVGGSMNRTSNGSVTLATGKSAIFQQTSQNVWISTPLAP